MKYFTKVLTLDCHLDLHICYPFLVTLNAIKFRPTEKTYFKIAPKSPIILYNVENWATTTDKGLRTFTETDLSNNSKADIIHRKALKYILGLSKSCPNMAIHGDTAELPLSIKGYTNSCLTSGTD